jgi:hypothetical protein
MVVLNYSVGAFNYWKLKLAVATVQAYAGEAPWNSQASAEVTAELSL